MLRSVLCWLTVVLTFASVAYAQQCPPQGDGTNLSIQALDILKNREVAPPANEMRPAITLEQILQPGNDEGRWDEHSGATITGIVVGVKVGGIETANCHARSPAKRDTHIEIALRPGALEKERMIVEVTPRWRNMMASKGVDWSTDALARDLPGKQVRVTGWLLFDAQHKDASENTAPGNPRNWRATAWEIHPIAELEVLGQ